MDFRILKDLVIDGSIRRAGETIQLTQLPVIRKLERLELLERINEADYRDRVEDVYPRISHDGEIRDVLVFVPVYRLEPETIESVMSLEWDGSISHLFQRDNPRPGETREIGIENQLHQYRRGRSVFLRGSYDAMLVIESDIIPPRDAIPKLVKADSDCAYGVYRFRGSNVINIFERYPGSPKNIGESLSLKKQKLRRAVKLGLYPCSGAGLGCILIRRRVLEAIDFRIEPRLLVHCDTHFNRDLLSSGFSQVANMRVICGHKDENGEILYPELPG